MMPLQHWWSLRKKFHHSIPTKVTADYVASTLDMKASSARANVLPPLKTVGLIKEDGTPTPLAKRWRDDQEYPAVCDEIKKAVYPTELLEAAPEPAKDSEPARRWFAGRTGHGEAAVKRMVAFYRVLSERDPSAAQQNETAKARPPSATKRGKVPRVKPPSVQRKVDDHHQPHTQMHGPPLHINVQIHISSDASPDQIDQVFSSMAKHLKGFYKGAEGQ
jgi:hypothetical protein